MNTNGKSDPANAGPSPLNANSVNAGIVVVGIAMRTPTASRPMVPTFMNVDR